MYAPLPASAEQVQNAVQNHHDVDADDQLADVGCVDPALSHPLAAEEWLASQILAASATDPRTICELALINKNFCSAANSNPVWQNLLPPAPLLDSVLKECEDKPLQYYHTLSKKDLYLHLCRSITLGGGLKKFWLDHRTGGECYIVSARALTIAWGSSPEYWEWLPCRGAWLPEVAFLRSLYWLDIKGKFQQVLRPGSYVVSFRMQVRPPIWRWSPIKLSLENLTYAHPPIKSRAYFHRRFPISDPPLSPPTPQAGQPTANDKNHSSCDSHVWVECDVGEFTVEDKEYGPVEVEFSMREVEVLDCKRGFLLDGVMVRPSYVVHAHERPTTCIASIYNIGNNKNMGSADESDDGESSDENNLYGVEDGIEDASDNENMDNDDIEDASDDGNADNDDHETEEIDEANAEETPLEHFVVCNANEFVVAGGGLSGFPANIFVDGQHISTGDDEEEASQQQKNSHP